MLRTGSEMPPGCSKRPSSEAAASEARGCCFSYVESLSAARTKLVGFFNILLDGEADRHRDHAVSERGDNPRRFDPASGSIATTHAGLQARLRRGVKDWEGQVVFPEDGRALLSALYDSLFLNGYPV